MFNIWNGGLTVDLAVLLKNMNRVLFKLRWLFDIVLMLHSKFKLITNPHKIILDRDVPVDSDIDDEEKKSA